MWQKDKAEHAREANGEPPKQVDRHCVEPHIAHGATRDVAERHKTSSPPPPTTPSIDREVLADFHSRIERLRHAVESGSFFRTAWNFALLSRAIPRDPAITQAVIATLTDRGEPLLNVVCKHQPSPWLVRGLLRLGFNPSRPDPAGNTALHALAQSPAPRVTETAVLLLHFGGKLALVNTAGRCPLSILAEQRDLKTILDWCRLVPSSQPYSPTLAHYITRSLIDSFSNPETRFSPRSLTTALDHARDILGADTIATVLKTPGASGLTILHRTCIEPKYRALIPDLVQRGADINQPTTADLPLPQDRAVVIPAGSTPMHIAIHFLQSETLSILIENGADQTVPNAVGENPLLCLFRKKPIQRAIPQLSVLELSTRTLAQPDHHGIAAIDLILTDQPTRQSVSDRFLLPEIAASALHARVPGLSVAGAAIALETLKALPSDLEDEKVTLYRLSKNIDHVVYYLLACAEATGAAVPAEDHAPLARLLPHLINFYPPGSINNLIGILPRKGTGAGRWDSELMALLNHPRRSTANEDGATKAIVFAFQDLSDGTLRQKHITWPELRNWARIGTLAHSFSRWKYETVRAVTPKEGDARITLLEAYGFKRIPDRPTDSRNSGGKGFGTGFFLYPGDRKIHYVGVDRLGHDIIREAHLGTIVEFRRAYLLVSNPHYGSLIIRNSSPVFGRDTLTRAAYYRSPSYTPRDALLNLTRAEIEETFTPIGGAQAASESAHITSLLDDLTGVMQDFAAWKYDTRYRTAWYKLDDQSALELAGGHYSPGFEKTIQAVHAMAAATKRTGVGWPPELAFIDPDQAPWAPFDFIGTDDKPLTRLQLDDRTLDVLGRLSRSDQVTDAELEETGVRAFLQEAGLLREGELVLLTPNR
jgi:hypothetical protein